MLSHAKRGQNSYSNLQFQELRSIQSQLGEFELLLNYALTKSSLFSRDS